MKQFLKIGIVIFLLTIGSFLGMFLRLKLLDDQIKSLQDKHERIQEIADELVSAALHTDSQSKTDITYMNTVFEHIFTFYDLDGFEKAKQEAIEYGLPVSFVNRFYDTAELTGAYAEAMLDVMCKYNSADFYLLDRQGDEGIYYAVVVFDTVKYSNSQFKIAFFIGLKDHGSEVDRFTFVDYFSLE